MDDFNAYRAMCANRLRRLERYKKARSFCNIDDDEPSIAERPSNFPNSAPPCCGEDTSVPEHFFGASRSSPAFEVIREKMFSLMENDMSLLQQLLTLGDQITEMKKLKEQNLRKCQSQSSLENDEDDDNEDQFDDGFSASMSEVTTFCVGENQPQYFSRQNSVLRIPIPPRNSNRFGHKRIPRRPSEMLRLPPPVISHKVGAEVYEITTEKSAMPKENSFSDERCSIDPSYITVKNRSSNSSIDSGIRESSSSSPSPTFEKEVI
ncbi:hypothetical protein KIN20_024051 [Parelaphostrongylus tenuis]|uniref:Uncharacterized protein n=1 Tax=Parelaphostrongylus tenuis TaxID=148309 RepID=A0AAD5N7T6_PARTN|nr:hypothetical protein KIN20_024051 [Parelaphostrongylus tenuis]